MANVWTTKGTDDVLHEVDPVSRIEGHLGVKVSVDGTGKITDANAHGNLWRGFENFLLGREVNDAITFVQRICGVCPVPHGLTSTYCVDTVLGYSEGHITFKTATVDGKTYGVPPKAVLIRNIVLGLEFLMSSITHFYHLAAPSYIQGPALPPWTPYFDSSYYSAFLLNNGGPGGTAKAVPDVDPLTGKLWDAVIYSYVKALKIRRMTFEAGALFAGRMPMTSCFVGGGVTNDGTEDLSARIAQAKTIATDIGKFIIQEYVPIALALGVLPEYADWDSQATGRGHGAGLGRFLSWGGFPSVIDDSLLLPGGVFDTNTAAPASYPATGSTTGHENVTHFRVVNKAEVKAKFLSGALSVPTNLTEDIKNSRYGIAALDTAVYTGTSAYPGDVARTFPQRSEGYTFMKAPRWATLACEVGPLARLAVAGIYPVDGVTALATISGVKEIYTVDGAGGGGLDLRVVQTNIWHGLVNDGLCTSGTDGACAAILALKGGLSTLDRLRARAIESLVIVQAILGAAHKDVGTGTLSFPGVGWLDQLDNPAIVGTDTATSTWRASSLSLAAQQLERQGWGGTEAPRGALMHQATVQNRKITKYQCIVPTTWNGSPKAGVSNEPGAIEAAIIGAPFSTVPTTFKKQDGTTGNTIGGVEVLRIAQSFDPCIACAIH